MKRKLCTILTLALALTMALTLSACGSKGDTPPQLTLNGTALDLSSLTVSDLNDAGFYLGKNDNTLEGKTYKELLSYYNGDNKDVSMGGVSILNRNAGSKEYTKCEIFEITAKAYDKEGNETGLEATYNGEAFFGKTRDELIALFGEPGKESVDYLLTYYTENKDYTTTFTFDLDTDLCYMVEIDRYEENVVH